MYTNSEKTASLIGTLAIGAAKGLGAHILQNKLSEPIRKTQFAENIFRNYYQAGAHGKYVPTSVAIKKGLLGVISPENAMVAEGVFNIGNAFRENLKKTSIGNAHNISPEGHRVLYNTLSGNFEAALPFLKKKEHRELIDSYMNAVFPRIKEVANINLPHINTSEALESVGISPSMASKIISGGISATEGLPVREDLHNLSVAYKPLGSRFATPLGVAGVDFTKFRNTPSRMAAITEGLGNTAIGIHDPSLVLNNALKRVVGKFPNEAMKLLRALERKKPKSSPQSSVGKFISKNLINEPVYALTQEIGGVKEAIRKSHTNQALINVLKLTGNQ